jgi:hypothetical protein
MNCLTNYYLTEADSVQDNPFPGHLHISETELLYAAIPRPWRLLEYHSNVSTKSCIWVGEHTALAHFIRYSNGRRGYAF